MPTIIKFYKHIWIYKKYYIPSIIVFWLGQIGSNYSLYFIKDLLDSIEKTGPVFGTLINISIFFIVVRIFSVTFTSFGNYLNDLYIAQASATLRTKIITHIHNLDFSYHTKKQSGALISLIKRGDGAFWGIDFILNRTLIQMFIDYVFILFAFWSLDYRLTIIVLLTIIANLISTKIIISKNITARRIFNEAEDQMSGLIVDNMINYETVKLFAQEAWEQKRLKTQYVGWLAKFKDYANTFRLIDIVTNIIGISGAAITMVFAIQLLIAEEISIGQFTLVITFVTSFFPKLTWLIYEIRGILKQLADLEKYLDLLDVQIEVEDSATAIELKNVTGEIQFNNVTFAYPNRKEILSNFDLKIADGESVAFVGYSGAGKSTLIKLLLRFYDVNTGDIRIDGNNITKLTKASLRKNIGLVPQEPILFNDTIGFNISYPNPSCSTTEIKNATKLANLADFIESLPEKYDTIVGERGIKLSGGQKQRLAIARMFLANPQIIVFDEATSQLDSESEQLIQDAFWRIAKNKTTLIIAHRLSTVMRADRIIVIDKGRIVEQGKHQDLISNTAGIYYKLWNIQKGIML